MSDLGASRDVAVVPDHSLRWATVMVFPHETVDVGKFPVADRDLPVPSIIRSTRPEETLSDTPKPGKNSRLDYLGERR